MDKKPRGCWKFAEAYRFGGKSCRGLEVKHARAWDQPGFIRDNWN